MEEFLALTGIFILPFIMIILIARYKSKERIKRYELQADLYAKALEKGQPLSADLFVELKRKRNPLNTGIICVAVGLGIALFIWMAGGAVPGIQLSEAASVGIIPFLIGVAFLIIHFIEKKNKAANHAE